MKLVLCVVIAGFLINCGFSAVIAHWFPRPNPKRPAWNIAKETALDNAGVGEGRVSQEGQEHAQYPSR